MVRLPGSADELARLLRNLGDNALTHTHITLGLRRDDTHAVLTVTDDGPGIPVGDREHIFVRFRRLGCPPPYPRWRRQRTWPGDQPADRPPPPRQYHR